MTNVTEMVISPEQMPCRLDRAPTLGPLTIMVPDFADPCGMAKIPRTVADAYPADVWDPHNRRYTRGRWQIVFAGIYLYPMILVTSGAHNYHVTLDAPTDTGGPCQLCRAHANQNSTSSTADQPTRERRRDRPVGAGRKETVMEHPQPGDHVIVTWPHGRRFSTVSSSGSYIGRRDVRLGRAIIDVVEFRSQPDAQQAQRSGPSMSTPSDSARAPWSACLSAAA